AAGAGFKFAMYQPRAEDLAAVQAYLRSLQPERSPYRLANGDLSEKAKRGKAIFEDAKVGCNHCHTGEQFTSGKSYNVGTHGEFDAENHTQFDTPSLIEIWRTAPYLHDGRAVTLQEIFTKYNPNGRHGNTSQLSKEQIDDLVEYLLSL
ncbi:MAG: c-type cytochrome, partial [Bacillota bacterium]